MAMEQVIHYCWFGGGTKPMPIRRCIRSWKKIKGYKIVEWNEHNFNVNVNKFVRDAFDRKKYAFVSDYCRIWALYTYGGIYLDTDIYLFKDIGKKLAHPFACFERPGVIQTAAMSANKHDSVLKEVLDIYDHSDFVFANGEANLYVGDVFTFALAKGGDLRNNTTQKIGKFTVYSSDYFYPWRWNWHSQGGTYKTKNTVGEHLYIGSWAKKKKTSLKTRIYRMLCFIFGTKKTDYLLRRQLYKQHASIDVENNQKTSDGPVARKDSFSNIE